jgi:phosphatidylserine decarboxylase
MKIHKEGHKIIGGVFMASILAILLLTFTLKEFPIVFWVLLSFIVLFNIWAISFFRVPARNPLLSDEVVVSAADGKVVVVEEVEESEFFGEKRIQVSVFMSPLNVHVNWFPINGQVTYARYHPGKFLFAYYPKSSIENERTSIAIDQGNGKNILIRQVAGFLARRIVYTAREGNQATQGTEFGMIKFGSRVDFYLPLNSEILVKVGDKVKGKQTPVARFR